MIRPCTVCEVFTSFLILLSLATLLFYLSNFTEAQVLSSSNQSSTTISSNDFHLYENTTYGISMKYPSNWIRQESFGNTVFMSPLQGEISMPATVYVILSPNEQNITLDEYVNNIRTMTEGIPSSSLEIIELSPTNLKDIPAYRMIYRATIPFMPPTIGDLATMALFTAKDDKLFYFAFSSTTEEFSDYMPTFEIMADSIKITQQ